LDALTTYKSGSKAKKKSACPQNPFLPIPKLSNTIRSLLKKRIKRVSKQLTETALNIFVNHHFSLSWFRAYFVGKKITDLIADQSVVKTLSSKENDQLYIWFLFLIRELNATGPDVYLLSLIMELFDWRNVWGYQFDSEKLTPVYFDCEINSKIQNSPPAVASLWRNVKSVAFKNQRGFLFYAVAKSKELAPNNSSYEREIFTSLMNPSSQLHSKSIRFDCDFRCELETALSFSDKLKYYESLLEKSQEWTKIVECWKEVIRKEKDGQCSDFHILLAWALQRERDSSVTRKIWTVALEVLETTSNRLLFNQIVRLAGQADKVLLSLRNCELDCTAIENPNMLSLEITKLIKSSFPVWFAQKFKETDFITLEKLKNERNSVRILVDVISCDYLGFLQDYNCITKNINRINQKYAFFPELLAIISKKLTDYLTELNHYLASLYEKVLKPDLNAINITIFKHRFRHLKYYPSYVKSLLSKQNWIIIYS
jgi:hypothetical protein